MPFELRPPHAAVEPAAPTRLDSRDLFGPAAREVEIQHGDGVYRLRRTSLGKLILTK
jgi:hemin uptake protein HemP